MIKVFPRRMSHALGITLRVSSPIGAGPSGPSASYLAHTSIRECTLSRCGLSPSGQAAYRSGAE